VLAGFMRILSAAFLDGWPDRVINTHPSLLPAFRGAHAVRDALEHGVKLTGSTVHLVDEEVDHGPIVAQRAVEVREDDDEASLHERIKHVEHELLPACVKLLCHDRLVVAGRTGPHPTRQEPPVSDAAIPVRRALVSCFDKTGVATFAGALHERGVALISTGSTAATIREADVPVTEVAEVTGFPECLDGRVKTLHPRIHAGILADRTDPAHVAELEELEVDAIDLVVVNLYPFERTVQAGPVTTTSSR
jgi:phosphoribosylaminoimidazolecarboxamide formyltransferase / IMP cyclohydrolase